MTCDHEQGFRDAIDAMREALAAGDAWSAANPEVTIPDSPEWKRWAISQDRLRAMVEEFDFAARFGAEREASKRATADQVLAADFARVRSLRTDDRQVGKLLRRGLSRLFPSLQAR